ncbi:MAG TPA: cellulose synthase [Streptosporangiaceae bacterium]|jgi:hypothetical protein
MGIYSQIAWLPLCGGLTGLGLVASWFVFRRRGFAAGLRGVAWSLLPLAAYLTGAVEMIWKMGVAIGDFASSFVFSPKVWSGVAVAVLAALAFVVSGLLRRSRPAKPGRKDKARAVKGDKPGTALESRPPKAAQRAASVADDDDFAEIEKILRNRGIS